jgi:uncharacterized protein YozE (UPF0346 family)
MQQIDFEALRTLAATIDAEMVNHVRPNALHHPSGDHVDSNRFIYLTRAVFQAKELVATLEDFRTECQDFATGNLQLYIDDFNKDNPQGKMFFVFDEIWKRFDSNNDYAFPKQISQFSELVDFAESSGIAQDVLCVCNTLFADWYKLVTRYHESNFNPDGRACAAELLTYYVSG